MLNDPAEMFDEDHNLEICHVPQWLVWSQTNGRKVPRDCHGNAVGATHLAAFMDYDFAYDRMIRGGFDGIGFCFTRDDPYGGVDLDDCLDNDGEIKLEFQPILEMFRRRGYIEISPSGKGVKVFGKFRKPEDRPCATKFGSGAIEIYDHSRFFTLTFRQLEHFSVEVIKDIQPEIDELYATYYPTRITLGNVFLPDMSSHGDLVKRATLYAQSVADPGVGLRNVTCFKLAGHLISLRDGEESLTSDQLDEIIHNWNDQLATPMDFKEVSAIIWRAVNSPNPRPAKYSRACELNPEITAMINAMFGDQGKSELSSEEVSTAETAKSAQTELPAELSVVRLSAVIDQWEKDWDAQKRPVIWDSGIQGFHLGPGMVVLVGGGPGSGKTTLTQQIVRSVLENHVQTSALVLSIEVPPDQIWVRMLAAQTGYDYHRLRGVDGDLHQHSARIKGAAALIKEAIGDRLLFQKLPLDFAGALKVCEVARPDLIVFDYVQRIPIDMRRQRELLDEMGQVMSWCRMLADQQMAVLVVSSLARPEKRSDGYQKPSITSFRGSAELEYAPDECWQMVREQDNEWTTLHHVKARYRDRTDIHLLQGDDMRFSVYEPFKLKSKDVTFESFGGRRINRKPGSSGRQR